MFKRTVLYGVARLTQILALSMIVPATIAWFDLNEMSNAEKFFHPGFMGFWIAFVSSLTIGSLTAILLRRSHENQTVREGFAVVTIGWVVLTFFGCIPLFVYFVSQTPMASFHDFARAFTDAFFEIMSGFTTTGASILTDVESLPRGLLFWRSLTHWLGGMGIVTLALAIFPALGVSGYHMFKGEVPGPTAERLQPRLRETAGILWGVYAGLSGLQTILLLIGGMDWFDALCHTFGTMATGGFSTKNLSIGYYSNDFIHWVIIVFMFLAGTNFLLHFNALKGNARVFAIDREFRMYAAIVVIGIALVTISLNVEGLPHASYSASHFRSTPWEEEVFMNHVAAMHEKVADLYDSIREASFQFLSIVTTTGFVTSDYDVWPTASRLLLLSMMFVGGCAGSTGGGMKVIRVLVVTKNVLREVVKMARPRLLKPVMIGNNPLEEQRVANIIAFVLLFIGLFVLSSLLMTLFIPDLVTASSAVIACIGNVGPGLAGVGPFENYSWIPLPGKWLLIANMLLGRLEIFTVLILLRPSVWR